MSELATSTDTVIVPPVEPTPVAESDSVASHAAQFGANRAQPSDDDEESPRRRSRSSQATPQDVEKIAELTKRLRTAETELGFTVERQQGESQRVYELRRKAEIAEALRDAHKAKPEPPKLVPVVSNAPTFDEKEPTYDDVADSPDPVQALSRKLAAYDRRKESFEAKQVAHRAQTEAATAEQSRQDEQTAIAFRAKLDTYLAANPTHKAVMESTESLGDIPPALSWAFIRDDKGPELMYYYANHHDDLSEMILLASGQPVSEQSVALLRRRLHARVQADSTGAAAPVQSPRVTARPPTPVGTLSMKTADELPGDGASIAEHSKAFLPKRR